MLPVLIHWIVLNFGFDIEGTVNQAKAIKINTKNLKKRGDK